MKPKFSITDRDGRKALWVHFSKNGAENIWDLSSKELTENVKAAIIHAYYIGASHAVVEMAQNRIEGDFTNHFEEK